MADKIVNKYWLTFDSDYRGVRMLPDIQQLQSKETINSIPHLPAQEHI